MTTFGDIRSYGTKVEMEFFNKGKLPSRIKMYNSQEIKGLPIARLSKSDERTVINCIKYLLKVDKYCLKAGFEIIENICRKN